MHLLDRMRERKTGIRERAACAGAESFPETLDASDSGFPGQAGNDEEKA
jgi:hypothetical protein